MNITLSVEPRTVENVRIWAAEHGTSLNAVVRDYLAQLASGTDPGEAAQIFADNARNMAGKSVPGTRFSRDDVYHGSRFGTAGQ